MSVDPLAGIDRILYGGDYNPEQWPESVWDDDVRLMRSASVNVATLPVFGWVSVEPAEGRYDFDWLDRVIDKLSAGGVRLCLATATASVPAWMDHAYPDVRRVDAEGRRQMHGNRHTFCPNSPNFRRLSRALAGALGERYGRHPALALWHVSNEYGAGCYCDLCAAAFRQWLRARYGTLDELNARWWARFWGHTYTDWSQIEPPALIGDRSNQAMLIDYDRFQSASVLACYIAERDALRAATRPGVPITTNFMGAFKPLDYQAWAREIDLVAWDSYPQASDVPARAAFSHSLMRGLKEGQPWLLLEQTPSQTNWQPYSTLKPPGVMRLQSYQAIAHGSDAAMFFQWRRSRGAMEAFHGAFVEHSGRADTRVFQECAALGRELAALGERTLGARVETRAAVLFDWNAWWAIEYAAGPPRAEIGYVQQARDYYEALHRQGIVADVVAVDADLSGYAVVVAPLLFLLRPGAAEKLRAYVERGGVLIGTYYTGVVDESYLVFEGGYPGPLRELFGLWVEETDILPPARRNGVAFTPTSAFAGATALASLVCERLRCDHGATPIAEYTADFYAGEPAITEHAVGRGKAYYLGTKLDASALEALLAKLCAAAGAHPPLGPQPDGVEVTRRAGSRAGATQFYVLNHNAGPVTIDVEGVRRELITGVEVREKLELAGYGVAILE